MVGAIDFGTSYSGYAYSFHQSPTTIQRNRWNAGSRGLISEKTPTCILFDGDQNFSAFGFDAEDEFADFCYEKKQRECYFFRGYKMELYDKMVGMTSPLFALLETYFRFDCSITLQRKVSTKLKKGVLGFAAFF